jgi:excisionase family DNA binding protein
MARLSIHERLDHLDDVLKVIKSQLSELLANLKGASPVADVQPAPASHDLILSAKDVADLLEVDIDKIYLKCRNEELPYFRMGKLYKFRKSDILEWQEAQTKISAVSVDDFVDNYLQRHRMKG